LFSLKTLQENIMFKHTSKIINLSLFIITPLFNHLNATESTPKPQTSDIAERGGGGHGAGGGAGGAGGGRGEEHASQGNRENSNQGGYNRGDYNGNGYNHRNYGYEGGWGGGYGYGYDDAGYVPYAQPSYDLDENAPQGEFSFDDGEYEYNSPNNSDSGDNGE
jgi:hypothetical protein